MERSINAGGENGAARYIKMEAMASPAVAWQRDGLVASAAAASQWRDVVLSRSSIAHLFHRSVVAHLGVGRIYFILNILAPCALAAAKSTNRRFGWHGGVPWRLVTGSMLSFYTVTL